jgi:hypothetical protein
MRVVGGDVRLGEVCSDIMPVGSGTLGFLSVITPTPEFIPVPA